MRMNISVPDILAEQVRERDLPISAICQRALREELERLRSDAGFGRFVQALDANESKAMQTVGAVEMLLNSREFGFPHQSFTWDLSGLLAALTDAIAADSEHVIGTIGEALTELVTEYKVAQEITAGT